MALNKTVEQINNERRLRFIDKCAAAAQALSAELTKRGISHKVNTDRLGVKSVRLTTDVDGVYIRFTEDKHGGWERSGKLRIVVDHYPSPAKQFPERNSGFDYEAITEQIVWRLNAARVRRDNMDDNAEAVRRNEEACERIRGQVGALSWFHTPMLAANKRGLQLQLESLTEDQALAILRKIDEVLG